MKSIEKTIFLKMVNSEISKLPDYDPAIKIIDISVDANGLINNFSSNQFEGEKYFLTREYIEQVEHLFNGHYNRLI